MNFEPSEEDRVVAEAVRRAAEERWRPRYASFDRGARFGAAELRELGELGVLGMRVPEPFGGTDDAFVRLGLVVEELARADFNVSVVVEGAAIAAELLRSHASEALQREWLPRVATGDALVAFSLTEPGAGSDAANLRAAAKPVAGGFELTGEKASVTFAGQADACVVFARAPGDGRTPIDAFLVPLNAPGVSRERYASPGERLTERGTLRFEGVFVPTSHRLGAPGKGFAQAMTAFDFNRALIALSCLGAAQQSLDETIAFARQRVTFGKPLARHQAIAFSVAEHLTLMKAARGIALECLWRRDAGKPHTREAAMAKWLGPKVSVEAIHACLLMHGWVGYSSDLPFEQRLRDVIGLEIGDGTPEIMKAIVARDAFGREFEPLR
jgi:cyclohexanecarboxyl-CoA dehydrogenase